MSTTEITNDEIKRLIKTQANYYTREFFKAGINPDRAEIESEIGLALTKAINTYRSNEKAKFSTYAIGIIKNYMTNVFHRAIHHKRIVPFETVPEYEMVQLVAPASDAYEPADASGVILEDLKKSVTPEEWSLFCAYAFMQGAILALENELKESRKIEKAGRQAMAVAMYLKISVWKVISAKEKVKNILNLEANFSN